MVRIVPSSCISRDEKTRWWFGSKPDRGSLARPPALVYPGGDGGRGRSTNFGWEREHPSRGNLQSGELWPLQSTVANVDILGLHGSPIGVHSWSPTLA